jgi:hypothetical protein
MSALYPVSFERILRKIPLLESTLIWFLHEEFLPPLDCLKNLLMGIDADTIAVAAGGSTLADHRLVAWDVKHEGPSAKWVFARGTHLACTVLRSRALALFLDRSDAHPVAMLPFTIRLFHALGCDRAAKIVCGVPCLGAKETGDPLARLTQATFDSAFYRACYPEIAAKIARGEHPDEFHHFQAVGFREGRKAKLLTSVFDEAFYLEKNPDIRDKARKRGEMGGFVHFREIGHREGRAVRFIDPAISRIFERETGRSP